MVEDLVEEGAALKAKREGWKALETLGAALTAKAADRVVAVEAAWMEVAAMVATLVGMAVMMAGVTPRRRECKACTAPREHRPASAHRPHTTWSPSHC